MISFSKKNSWRHKQNKLGFQSYEPLEARQLLAVTSVFNAGELAITLDAQMDVAVFSNDGANVTINGGIVDADAVAPGVQAVSINDVTSLSFVGANGVNNASVQLSGLFTGGTIDSMRFEGINNVVLDGEYVVGELDGDFVGANGQFNGFGSLTVLGAANFNSSSFFTVQLDNENNDFVGPISANTDGVLRISDRSDVLLESIDVGWLIVSADGMIEDTADSAIDVRVITNLGGGSIDLGNNGDAVNVRALVTSTLGSLAINDVDFLQWSGESIVGSANVVAPAMVTQGPFADVTVLGDAVIESQEIRLGVGGSNIFNTGRINVNSNDRVFVWENSSLELFGNNTAVDLDLIATGDITNSPGASINVAEITSVQSTTAVSLGNADDDNFRTGFLEFFANEVDISEDSNTVISGLANFAGNLRLDSNGSITDTDEAFIYIQDNGTFISAVDDAMATAGVVLGDSETDVFMAGNISFDVTDGNFVVQEDNNTTLANPVGFVNRATAVSIISGGSINTAAGFNAVIDTTARFEGANISIGQQDFSSVEFGSLTLVTPGDAAVEQTGAMFLTGTSTVGGNLGLVTDGSIGDSNTSNLTVGGLASFEGSSILLGDLELPTVNEPLGDFFDVGTLQFNSAGNVDITQDGDMLLAGNANHTANELRLSAIGNLVDFGRIQNGIGADLRAQGNLFLTALDSIDLGVNPADVVNFDNLNFNSPSTVNISATFADSENGFFIFGTSNSPNTASDLVLTTNVDVRDGTNAVIDISASLEVNARNIILGDTDTDCLMVPENAQFNTTDSAAEVTTDDNCPV